MKIDKQILLMFEISLSLNRWCKAFIKKVKHNKIFASIYSLFDNILINIFQ